MGSAFRGWPGLIEAFRDRLPVTDRTPVVTLLEGNTPLVDASRNLVAGARGATIGELVAKPIRPMAESESPFYVMVEAADRPGVLAAIATQFGNHGVSIKSMEQEGLGAEARIIFITHGARERDIQACLSELAGLQVVDRVGSVLRVIGE